MDGLTVRQLQDLCDEWGVKHTGSKAEIQRRLQTFYMGVPVHKAGCSKQFVMLEEEKPDDVSLRKSLVKKSREEDQTASAASKDAPSASESGRSFRIQGKTTPSKPGEKGSGIFRSDSSKNDKEKAYFCWASADSDGQKEEVPQAPKAGFQHPPINVGEVLPGVACGVCQQPMLVRQNRTKGNLFFGCSMFGRTGCRFTLCYDEGLDMRRGRGPLWLIEVGDSKTEKLWFGREATCAFMVKLRSRMRIQRMSPMRQK